MCGRELDEDNCILDGVFITEAGNEKIKAWCQSCQSQYPRLNTVVSNPVFENQAAYRKWTKTHPRLATGFERKHKKPMYGNLGKYDYGATFQDEWQDIDVDLRFTQIFSKPVQRKMKQKLGEPC